MIPTQTELKEQLKVALKTKDKVRLRTIRSILTACTNELVAIGKTPQDILSEEGVLKIITRLAKQHKESITQFEAAGRNDLVNKEKDELEVLEAYLPQMMSMENIEKVVKNKIKELKIDDRSKIGMLIGTVMKELSGKAYGNDVKDIVEKLLTNK